MVELLEDGTIGPDMAPRDAYRADPRADPRIQILE